MSYQRVIPRDLFNESKLLKCLGQLSLLIHDGQTSRWQLRFEHDGDQFAIELDGMNGGLVCTNVMLYLGSHEIGLYSRYNSKAPFPLCFYDESDGTDGDVFNDDGSLSQEFTDYLDHALQVGWR